MISCTVKLRPTCAQAATFQRWLWNLTGVYNWAIRTLEREPMSSYSLKQRLNGHSERMGIPITVLRGTAATAHEALRRHRKGIVGRPKLKGRRRPLKTIVFGDVLSAPRNGRISLMGIGPVRYHRQAIPEGRIGSARLTLKASGWYLCLFIKAEPAAIVRVGDGQVGIDPGFKSLLTCSNGEVIEHPHELRRGALRLAQAQRGRRKRLAGRLHERIGNRRKNRNHHLSKRLVSENSVIAFLKDPVRGMAHRFGKSVTSAGHVQLRYQLQYKSLIGGTEYVEVAAKNSTRTCSACGRLTGPSGWRGLSVRQWVCGHCGTAHDRDVNSAINALIAARGTRVEQGREALSGIAS